MLAPPVGGGPFHEEEAMARFDGFVTKQEGIHRGRRSCPYCARWANYGHAPTCPLRVVLPWRDAAKLRAALQACVDRLTALGDVHFAGVSPLKKAIAVLRATKPSKRRRRRQP
jgi:hypothetical protein